MERVTASLQRDGIRPQETIAISGANSIEYAVLFLGATCAGVAVAPLPTSATAEQIAGMLADSSARLLFVDATVPPLGSKVDRIAMDGNAGHPPLEGWLAPHGTRWRPCRPAADWPFNIIYSSGTTGTPKGIEQPYAMRWAHVARATSGSTTASLSLNWPRHFAPTPPSSVSSPPSRAAAQ